MACSGNTLLDPGSGNKWAGSNKDIQQNRKKDIHGDAVNKECDMQNGGGGVLAERGRGQKQRNKNS